MPLLAPKSRARHPLIIAALIIGVLGQYSLSRNQVAIGVLSYGVAAIMAATTLYRAIPQPFDYPESAAHLATERPTLPRPTIQNTRISFWRHWRYFTVADLLRGTTPNLPAQPQTSPAESAPILLPDIALPVTDTATTLTPTIVRWASFVDPQAVLTTAQGDVLVIDTGQKEIFRLNALGTVLNQWNVPDLPSLQPNAIALSPDGGTLYIADPTHHSVLTIALIAESGAGAKSDQANTPIEYKI